MKKNKNSKTKVSKLALLRQSCVMSPQRRRQRARLVAFILIGSVMISALIIGFTAQQALGDENGVENGSTVNFEPHRASELTPRQYIKQEIEKAGLDWSKVECTLMNESRFNTMSYHVNNNKTVDLGIWMINSVHFGKITPAQALDYKQATKFAIEKIKHDGNLKAWYGSLKCK